MGDSLRYRDWLEKEAQDCVDAAKEIMALLR